MRTTTGYFFMTKQKYTKPSLTIEQQIEFLTKQGLQIENHGLAQNVLSVVSYYRLSGYLLPFKLSHNHINPRQFKENIAFEHVWQLYQFDRELRLLVSDAIEKIEVAFRTALVNVTSVAFDPFWYVERAYFKSDKPYQIVLDNVKEVIRNKQELFIQHYFKKYNTPEYPPIWMMVEALSFGICSKLFHNIKSIAIRNEIAAYLGQHTTVIESWIRTLTYTRNLCAHHSRLWNRWFVNPPLIPKHDLARSNFFTTENYRFHLIAYILQQLLEKIAPKSHWKEKLFDLFKKYENYPGIEMGFKSDWKTDPFWKL